MMRTDTAWRLAISSISLALLATAARAQEVRVPVDAHGEVEKIDRAMEDKLSLFPTYANFEEALLYQLPDSSFALEVFYNADGKIAKQRTMMSAAEAETFRRRVSDSIAARLPAVAIDQDGRATLVAGATIYSLAFYGWAIPYIVDAPDTKTSVALYMLTSGAGFFIPYILTQHARVTDADAALALGAGQLGIAHGIFLDLLIEGHSATTAASLGGGMGLSIAEMVGGYYLADRTGMTPGKADVIYVGGLFGTGLGAGTGLLCNLFDDDERAAGGVALIGAGLGYIGGNALANMQSYTPGDAQVLFGAGALGAYVPLAITELTRGNANLSYKPYVASSMVGSLAGLAAGHFLVKDKDFSTSSGSYIVLGGVAGGLLGTGIAYLASSDARDNTSLYLSSSAAGGLLGFSAMYLLLRDDARRTETGSLWRFNLSPEGIAAYALGGRINLPPGYSAPIAQLQARF
jgi:hypothetical protein